MTKVDNENEKIKELFEACDLDSSGYIDQYELAAVVNLDPHEKELEEIFQQLDQDKDGKISIEEFTENYNRFQSLALQMESKDNAGENDGMDNTNHTRDNNNLTPNHNLNHQRRSSLRKRSIDTDTGKRGLKQKAKILGG